MENFREKIERKTFWNMFGWIGRKKNKWWDSGVFSPDSPKVFFFLLFIYFFFFLSGSCFFFLLFIYLFIYLPGRLPSSYTSSSNILFLLLSSFIFYFFCLDVIFFRHDFYFLINLGDWCFFYCLSILV